jgi:hypothetical protein
MKLPRCTHACAFPCLTAVCAPSSPRAAAAVRLTLFTCTPVFVCYYYLGYARLSGVRCCVTVFGLTAVSQCQQCGCLVPLCILLTAVVYATLSPLWRLAAAVRNGNMAIPATPSSPCGLSAVVSLVKAARGALYCPPSHVCHRAVQAVCPTPCRAQLLYVLGSAEQSDAAFSLWCCCLWMRPYGEEQHCVTQSLHQ